MFARAQRLFSTHSLAVSHPAVPQPGKATPGAGTRERTLLDLVMPQYHFRGGAKITVDATPEVVLRALDEVTLADMPLAYVVGTIRYLPGRLLGKQRPPDDQLMRPFLEVAMSFGIWVLYDVIAWGNRFIHYLVFFLSCGLVR